jgi:hydrogenase maturation protease
MTRPLVIGIGNVLRSDDGAGIAAAREVVRRYPTAECLTVHQLAPELADPVASASIVIFVDASVLVQTVAFHPLRPGKGIIASHVASPEVLLGLCMQLYGTTPGAAYLVQIPAHDLGFGDHLSAQTAAQVEDAVVTIVHFLTGQPAGSERRPAIAG